MKTAFVEIKYSSDATSFGGLASGPTMHADVIEIEAENEIDAIKKAIDKFKAWDICGMCSIRSYRFLRCMIEKESSV